MEPASPAPFVLQLSSLLLTLQKPEGADYCKHSSTPQEGLSNNDNHYPEND